VVPQKGSPSLTWWSTPFDHVLGNARLRDIKPDLEQFTVDTRRTLKQILHAHLPDQCKSARNFDPTSKVSQRIDLVAKDWNWEVIFRVQP
jgi:predicted MPP superfamily phosphohydrolase